MRIAVQMVIQNTPRYSYDTARLSSTELIFISQGGWFDNREPYKMNSVWPFLRFNTRPNVGHVQLHD